MSDIIARLVAILALAAQVVLSPPRTPPEASGGVGTAIESGRASYVAASYGPRYLALPDVKRGTWVRITGRLGSVVRESTDVGPDQSVFPDRVADLSYRDFGRVCGHDHGRGTCAVTVEFLGTPSLPATDS